jgi:CRP-like cAMP-binding protein
MRLLVIPGPAFRKLMTQIPGLSGALLATLSMRLREANAAGEP